MRAARESALPGSDAESVCGDSDDVRPGELAVRSAVEHRRLRLLPERSDDDLSGLRGGDRRTAAAAWQDCNDGGDAGVRHERRRNSGVGGGADECDTSELQPGTSNDSGVTDVWNDVIERIPSSVLRRSRYGDGDDDVHRGRQQRVRAVHADGGVRVGVGSESTDRVLGITVEWQLRNTAGCVDNWSLLHYQRRSERDVGVRT